ncbi:MAG: AmiS/UreI family transporter [Firmicutes bacterium]|nr:AmiS/UreI family transporter [Bacillota bacterium]
MLGIALTFVGIILVANGVLFMSNSRVKTKNESGQEVETLVPLVVHSPKTIAFFNVIVAFIIIIGNFILLPSELARDALPRHLVFQNAAAGLIFGVTYLFIAGNLLLKIDPRPFGWYSVGACVFSIVLAAVGFRDAANFSGSFFENHGLILGLLWIIWFFLWFPAVLQYLFNVKIMQKIFPWISISVGVIGAFVPAMLLLLGTWPLL